MNHTGVTRVSCCAFARIMTTDARIALRRARKDDRLILRPLGGSLRSDGLAGRRHLAREFGARGFEDPHELRFLVGTDELGSLYEWFRSHRQREVGIIRILTDVLAGDLRVLTADEVPHARVGGAYCTRHSGRSGRPGLRIAMTTYFVEVFDVVLPPPLMDKLIHAATPSTGLLRFATPGEVTDQSGPGGYVSSLARCLLPSAQGS